MIYSDGTPVLENTALKSGTVVMGEGYIVIGSRPWSTIEEARYDAQWIVNNGLRDVVQWLGEKPLPRKHITFNRVWLSLLKSSEVTIPTVDFLG